MMIKSSTKFKVLWLKMDEAYDHNLFLIKYAPKYYTKVDFETPDLKNYKIYSKTRSIKIARSVILKDYSKDQMGLILRTLKNQKKFIQALLGVEPSLSRVFHHLRTCLLDINRKQSWRMFVRLAKVEALELDFSNFEEEFDPGKYFKYRFWQHLSNLTPSLKIISLRFFHQINPIYPHFISKFVHALSQLPLLENLTVSLHNLQDSPFDSNLDLVQLSKYVTCLKAYELSFPHIQDLLAQLPHFEKLKELVILKTIPESEEEGENQQSSLSEIKNLAKLKNLMSLELSVCLNSRSVTLSFLENFAVSQSVESIKLSFHNLNWKSILVSQPLAFEENPSCAKFYRKWEQLKNLQSLAVSFTSQDALEESYELNFIAPVFKKLSTVSMLYYTDYCDDSASRNRALDFKILWDSVKHLKTTLKALLVETACISLRNFPEGNEEENNALKGLNLFGAIHGDINVLNLFKIFPKSTAYNEHKSQLEIGHLYIDSQASFQRFLRGLQDVPRNLKVALNIDIRKISAKEFLETINEYAPKIKARNFSKFNVWHLKNGIEANQITELQQIISKCKISNIMAIIDKSGKMVFEGPAFGSYTTDENFFGGGMQLEYQRQEDDDSSTSEESAVTSENDN